MIEAAYALVYDAGQVRLAQFGATYLDRQQRGLDVSRVVAQLRHLHHGLEVVALLPVGPDNDAVVALLIETYGLLAVAQDPFLRPLLPVVPTTGATVSARVLAIGDRAVVVAGKLLVLGRRLVASLV